MAVFISGISLVFVILSMTVLHAGFGGKYLAFALPGYALLAIAAVVSLPAIIGNSRSKPSHIAIFSAVLFFGYIATRAWFSPVEYYAAPELYLALAALTVYLLFANVLTSRRMRVSLVIGLLVLLVAHAVVGFLQFTAEDGFSLWNIWNQDKFDWRITGMYFNPNNAAIFFSAATVYALSLVLWTKWKWPAKTVLVFLSLVGVGLVVMSGSRSGVLCLSISLFVFVTLSLIVFQRFYLFNQWLFYSGLVVMGALAIAAVSYVYTATSHHDPLERMEQVESNLGWRMEAWQGGWRHFQEEDQPWIGTGAGSHYWLGRKYRSRSMQVTPVYVHNDYIELLAEYGITGALLLALLMITHGVKGVQAYSRLGFEHLQRSGSSTSPPLGLLIGSIAVLCGIAPAEFADFHLQVPANALLAAFALAILANPGAEGIREPEKTGRKVGPLEILWRIAIPLLMLWPAWEAWRRGPAEALGFQGYQVYMRDADYLRAAELLEQSAALDARNPRTLALLGDSRRELGVRAESQVIGNFYLRRAIPPLDRAITIDPYQDTARWSLAKIYDIYGAHDAAEALLQEYLDFDPLNVTALNHYAMHKLMAGEPKEAQEAAAKSYATWRKPETLVLHREASRRIRMQSEEAITSQTSETEE